MIYSFELIYFPKPGLNPCPLGKKASMLPTLPCCYNLKSSNDSIKYKELVFASNYKGILGFI
jgi:hypothetical protein